jgi:uncharacterized membrane protein
MNLRDYGRVALPALPLVAALHSALYSNALPARVASHFNGAGVADGWMAKEPFLCFYVGLVAFLAVVFGGIGFLIQTLPDGAINLPNKAYWLAPERRAATLRSVANDLSWFGIITCCLIIALMELTFRANLTPEPRLPGAALLLVLGFVVAEVVWLVGMVKRFAVRS